MNLFAWLRAQLRPAPPARRYRLGKRPARPDAVRFKLARYARPALPEPPPVFGHESAVRTWGMLGNDVLGDCVPAAAAHAVMLWNAAAGRPVRISTADVTDDYRDAAGYELGKPWTDQGTDLGDFAAYWRKTGIRDMVPVRHRIGAYLALRPGDVTQHCIAAYLYGAVLVGLTIGDNQQRQFDARQPWSGAPGPNAGGHCVLLVGRHANGSLLVVTWGAIQEVDPAFLAAQNDESIVPLSLEMLTAGKSPEGLDLAALQADLAALG